MNIEYSFDKRPTADQIIELYDNAGLLRPTYDKERIQKILCRILSEELLAKQQIICDNNISNGNTKYTNNTT